MVKKLLALLFTVLGGSLGYNYLPAIMPQGILQSGWFGILIGALIGLIFCLLVEDFILNLIKKTTDWLNKLSLGALVFGGLGLVIGLIISLLVNIPLVALSAPIVSDLVPILATIFLAYLGFYLGSTRREEIQGVFANRMSKDNFEETKMLDQKIGENFYLYKVLDTSTIIDGRILEVIRTGFLEGVFVVSTHVLQELQHIADSSDSLKRARGRRGLDILNALQKEPGIKVEMNDDEIEENDEVDIKLLYLARKLEGLVITNDYNLNKVAEFQNVKVLNVNELANVVKPVVIPGEKMRVLIAKQGTERAQGVGYLDDGTMVVIEEGKEYINEEKDIVVTSSLQTNAGRMIFAKLDDVKALEGDVTNESQ